MTAYQRGAKRENDLVKNLRTAGWSANRTPGSHGVADVVALRARYKPRLIQVKTDKAGPYAHFGPADRAALVAEAVLADARPELCWWPPDGGGPRFIPAEDWPA